MNDETPTGPADETLAATAAAPKPPGSLLPFDRVGPYRLIKTIGLGGMGEVFYAEQLEPIRRDVALKIIKPGMDSREGVSRFEDERQALPLLHDTTACPCLWTLASARLTLGVKPPWATSPSRVEGFAPRRASMV